MNCGKFPSTDPPCVLQVADKPFFIQAMGQSAFSKTTMPNHITHVLIHHVRSSLCIKVPLQEAMIPPLLSQFL
jgi:hypothetical protein